MYCSMAKKLRSNFLQLGFNLVFFDDCPVLPTLTLVDKISMFGELICRSNRTII